MGGMVSVHSDRAVPSTLESGRTVPSEWYHMYYRLSPESVGANVLSIYDWSV
jgi:hypothetical protein